MAATPIAWTAITSRKAVIHVPLRATHTLRKALVTQKRPRWRTKPKAIPTARPVRIMVCVPFEHSGIIRDDVRWCQRGDGDVGLNECVSPERIVR